MLKHLSQQSNRQIPCFYIQCCEREQIAPYCLEMANLIRWDGHQGAHDHAKKCWEEKLPI